MPIYTKSGDKGKTSLFGGSRVPKYHPQIEASGTADELTSYIGLVTTYIDNDADRIFLHDIQQSIYTIMGIVSGADQPIVNIEKEIILIEQKIDLLESKLPKLNRFILPGGTKSASHFHVLRTICRRTERRVVELFSNNTFKDAWNEKTQSVIVKYLNRLSDLFFCYGRWYNKGNDILT